MSNKSFIKVLLERRIPHILGSYLVAGTSLILFIEYLVEKYQFPSHYPTLSLFALIGILPSVIILSYFHGAPGKDEWTKVEKVGIPVNIFFIATILLFGDSLNIWEINKDLETPITKKELDAEQTRILVPHLGSRNELVKISNRDEIKSFFIRKYGKGSGNPSDITSTPFSLEEQNELYAELITKINTTFFPENIIYTSEDIERAFKRKAKIPPNFTTFPTTVEDQLLPDSIKKVVFEPFKYNLADTLNKIIEIVDDNEYANQLILIINGYNISPPLGNIEKVAYIDVLFKKVYDISRIDKDSFDKSIKTSYII